MLVAVADARGAQAAAACLDRKGADAGVPAQRVMGHDVAIAASRPATVVATSAIGRAAVEGWIDWAASNHDLPSTTSALRAARGDFALAAATGDGLLLSSGPAGGYRPIYVAGAGSSRVVAGTQMREVLDLLPTPPAIDVDYVAAQLMDGLVECGSSTPYADVKCVPMYEAWLVRPGTEPKVLSTLRPHDEPERSEDDPDLPHVLRDEFRAAVHRSATGAVCLGVGVGGGVDSSGLLAVACELRREGTARVEALSLDYETYHGDDRPYLRALASHLGIAPHMIRPREAAEFVGRTFVLDAVPCVFAPTPLSFALYGRAKAQGADVLLTGVGGDNVLDGRPTALGELFMQGHCLRAIREAARLRSPVPAGVFSRVQNYVVRPLLAGIEPRRGRLLRRRWGIRRHFGWAGPRLRRALRERVDVTASAGPVLRTTPGERYETLARSPFIAEMARSRSQEQAESRCLRREPFFDDQFLRAVASLPPLALLRGGYLRGLYREALSGLVPDEVRWRETKAIMQPALEVMVRSAGGFSIFEPLADVRMLADLGLVEPVAFRRCFQALSRDAAHSSFQPVWPVLALEAFLRQHEGDSSWRPS